MSGLAILRPPMELWNWRFVHQFVLVWLLASLPWLVVWCWVSDLGGYPINDDPFYAKPIVWWFQEGRLEVALQSGELTASSLAHIVSGACAMWGDQFSYRWLYIACIVQQSLGITALYFCARSLGHTAGRAALFAGSLLSFPLYYGHAFTFMTDGPATAFAAIALVFLLWGTMRGSAGWLCAGSLAVGWGYWIRQTNAALLAVPLFALPVLHWLQRRSESASKHAWPINTTGGQSFGAQSSGGPSSVRRLGLLFVAALGLACLSIGLLETSWVLPSSLSRVPAIQPDVQASYWRRMAIAVYGWILLVGWFSLPLCPMLVHAAYRVRQTMTSHARRFCDASALIFLVMASAPFALTAGRACITSATGNFIENAHFGPIFLSDMDEPGRWGELPGAKWPVEVWQLLTAASILAATTTAWWAARNIVQLIATWRARAVDGLSVCALGLIATAVSVGVAMAWLIEPNMDRYWLFLFPAIVLWWQLISLTSEFDWRWWSTAWAVGCMLLGLAMSIVFTHDMLAWNSARWQFVNSHLAQGHSADSLDGGRDVNAWLRLDEDPHSSARPGDDSAWWSGRAKYAIAAGERKHWHVIDRLKWDCWATGRTNSLLVLEHD